MNKGLNIFLVILLCVVLYIGLLMSFYSSDNSDSWNPQQGYTMPMGGKSSTSAVSVGVGSTSTGVSVPMRSVSRSMRSSRAVSLYAPAQNSSVAHTQYPIGGTPSNSVASPLYTTSSATMKSFGGGTNGAVSMSSGVVSSNATSSPTSFVSMSSNLPSPLAYYPQSTTSFDGAQLTFAASSLQEIGASAVSYGASAPRGISGRRNAAPTNNGYASWLRWLDENGSTYADGYDDETGTYTYSEQGAWEAYVDWFSMVYGCNPGEYTGSDPIVTWNVWLGWFTSNNGSHKGNSGWHNFVPVGDYLPLLLMTLLYACYRYIRHLYLKKI